MVHPEPDQVPQPPDLSEQPGRHRPQVPWSLVDVIAVFLLTLVAVGLVTVALLGALPGRLATALTFPVTLAILALIALLWVRWRYPGNVRAMLGRERPTAGKLMLGVGYGLGGFLVLNVGLALVLLLLAALLGLEVPRVQEGIRTALQDPGALPFVAVAIVVLAPIAEEVFFRGLLYQALAKRLGVVGGIIVSSLVFGLAHLEPGNLEGSFYALLVLAPFGAFLAWSFHRYQTLLVPVAMHATFNALALSAILAGLG